MDQWSRVGSIAVEMAGVLHVIIVYCGIVTVLWGKQLIFGEAPVEPRKVILWMLLAWLRLRRTKPAKSCFAAMALGKSKLGRANRTSTM